MDAVTNGTNTIGYADASKAGDLGTAAILVGDEYVNYSPEAAAAVVDESPAGDTAGDTDLSIKIDRKTTDPTHYPLVLVSYAIGCLEYTEADLGPLVAAYVGYMASEEGQAEACSVCRRRAALGRPVGCGRGRAREREVVVAGKQSVPPCRAVLRELCTRGAARQTET